MKSLIVISRAIFLACVLSGMTLRVSAGMLSGTIAILPTGSVVDLTAQGPLDWVHWGMNTEYGWDRKAGVPELIGPLVSIIAPNGTGPYQMFDNFSGHSWTDGSPNTFATNTTTGIYVISKGSGFQLSVPADAVRRRLKLYVGTFGAQGRLDAALSDNSAPGYQDSTIDNDSNGPSGVYTLDYAANSPGQLLTVTFSVLREHDNRVGNATLQAAALAYVFSNNPPSVTLVSPADSLSFSSPANVPLAAIASDSDGTIAKVEFFQGVTKLGESTNGDYSLIWSNALPGDYLLRAVATDSGGLTSTSKPVEIFIYTNGGSLSGSVSIIPGGLDLTAEGSVDWGHWGFAGSGSFDHKAGISQQITDFTHLGTNLVQQSSDYPTGFSWSDGTPNGSAFGTTTSATISGLANGFELNIPAAPYTKTLKLYLGLFASEGKLQASLGDFSAPSYVSTEIRSFYNNAYGVCTLNFASASSNQFLRVRFTSSAQYDRTFGAVSLAAATLSAIYPPLPVVLVNPRWNNGTFSFSFLTQSNRLHTVQYAETWKPLVWQTLTTLPGDGTTALIIDLQSPPGTRNYRVGTQ
jgi:hypothetical protein